MNRSDSHFQNFRLEIGNFLAFAGAVFKLRDKRMRRIVWGTFRRQILVYFFTRKTLRYIEKNRQGACAACGVCCQFIRKCPYLTNKNRCSLYEGRHLICKVYPISDYDIQLVSRISDKKCGFYFRNATDSARRLPDSQTTKG